MAISKDNLYKKTVKIRAIFIMYLAKIFLCFGIFGAIKWGGLNVHGLESTIVLYTAIAYVVSFLGAMASILAKNSTALRAVIAIDFLSSIPAKAPIGFIVAIASIILSFTADAKSYFNGTYVPVKAK